MEEYRSHCEERFKHDLQKEVNNIRAYEVSRLRIEEQQKYRLKE